MRAKLQLTNVVTPAFDKFFRTFSSFTLRRDAENSGILVSTPERTQWCVGLETGGDEPQVVAKIKNLSKQGHWDRIVDVFGKSQQTTPIYNVTISAAHRCGKYMDGLDLFTAMRTKRVEQSASTYTAVMTIHSHLGNAAEVRSLLDEVLCLWKDPLGLVFTPWMNVKAREGDIAGVQAAFEEVVKLGAEPDAAHYGCLLKACRNAANSDATIQVLLHMRKAKRALSVIDYTLAMGAIRTSALACTDFCLAKERIDLLLSCMREDSITPNAYFIEEIVAAHVGQDLRKFSIPKLPAEHALASVKGALDHVDESERKGLKLTNMTRSVSAALRQYLVSIDPSAYDIPQVSSRGNLGNLPEGWHSAVDPSSGQIYYYNSAGVSQWEWPRTLP